MIETLTIITLSLLALFYFRPGKTEPLQNPLTINRVGQFHAVLAPKINLAQPLLESISNRLNEQDRGKGNTRPYCFMVHDKDVKAHGADFYLLAAELRDGVLYFHAAAPKADENNLETIRHFLKAEPRPHHSTQLHQTAADSALLAAIHGAAKERGAELMQLTEQ